MGKVCEYCDGTKKIEVMYLRHDGESTYTLEPCICTETEPPRKPTTPKEAVEAQIKTITDGLQ